MGVGSKGKGYVKLEKEMDKVKITAISRNFRSNQGVIDAVDENLGDQEEGCYVEAISKLEQRWRKRIEVK